MRPTLIAILLLTLGLTHVTAASAQTGSEAQAAEHFERGVELYREGSLDAALVEFERAYELVPTPGLLYNLAQVQAERAEYVVAIQLFERYLAEADSEIPEKRRTQVEDELLRLRKRVASLWVETNVEGATLFINDVEAGRLPMTERVLINAGMCRIRVEKSGYRTQTQTFKVAGGESPRLNLPLVENETPPPVTATSRRPNDPPAQDSAPVTRPSYTPFWISAAATGVLGGATLTFGLLTLDANEHLDEELDTIPADPDGVDDARSKVSLFATLTDGFAVGTLVAAGFAVYFLADPPQKRANTTETGLKSLRVIPLGSGAMVGGRF